MPPQPNASDLVVRIVELESELKQFKRRTFIAIALVMAGGLIPALVLTLQQPFMAPGATPGRSGLSGSTKEFTVTDSLGRPRVSLRTEKGLPGLFLYNERGEATLRVSETGVQALDAEGRTQGRFGHVGQSVGLALGPEDGAAQASLTLYGSGPALLLSDPQGNPRASLALVGSVPSLSLADSSGQERLGLAAAEGGAHLRLSDGAGHVRTMLRAGRDGGTALDLFDAAGDLRISMGLNLIDEPAIELPAASRAVPPPPTPRP